LSSPAAHVAIPAAVSSFLQFRASCFASYSRLNLQYFRRRETAMKYAPLIWSALWRKPTEAVLTWLTVTAAFALFGLMLGVNATLQSYIDSAPMDIISVFQRFPSAHLQVGMRDPIERIDGVSDVAVLYGLRGHHVDLRNSVHIIAVDEGAPRAAPEFDITPAQWKRLFSKPDGLYVSRKAAARWGLEEDDTFVITAGKRADGSEAWPFQVLGVVPDSPDSEGFLIGNYHYVDESRPAQDRGRDVTFQVRVRDPARSAEISRQIVRLFANSGTPTNSISRRQAMQNMANSDGNRSLATSVVGAAGLFMILLLVANGIAQSVRERAPELAMLKALGFRNRNLMGLVVCEAAIPCLAGAVLGLLLAQQLARWPAKFLPGDFANLPVPTMSASVMLQAIGFAAALACVSSVVPLMRVARVSVVSQLGNAAK
jgi:putative ABC transport system permease protein